MFEPMKPQTTPRNVDGLHQAAGNSADLVVEVHGNTQDSHLVHSKMERTNETHETHETHLI